MAVLPTGGSQVQSLRGFEGLSLFSSFLALKTGYALQVHV